MALDQRDLSIITQSATHDAAEIYASVAPLDGNGHRVWDNDLFEAIRQGVLAGTIDTIKHLLTTEITEPVATVQQAFPGAQLVTPDGAPFTTPNEQQQIQTPPVPGYPQPQQQFPYPAPQQPVYAPQGAPVGYPPPQVPQGPPAYGPPPQQVGPPPGGGGFGACPKCFGATYDNRADNMRKRQFGYKLAAEFKCKNKQCGGAIWPDDYQAYQNAPIEPR